MSQTTALALGAFVLAAIALVASLFAATAPDLRTTRERDDELALHDERLVEHMALLQRYAEKLHHAGTAQNWPLAQFYVDEMEEQAEAVARGGFIEDGIDVSFLADSLLPPALHRVAVAVETERPDVFTEVYGGLVATCNRCHQEAMHPFVRITVPRANSFSNQDFAPADARSAAGAAR